MLHLPQQSSLSYKLIGIAVEPRPVSKFQREITCKTYHTESLPVHNWLSSPQEFYVVTQTDNATANKKTLYKLTGNSVINVPANTIREYKWTIYVLKEGILNVKVVFHNVKTNEYLFYEIALIVRKCEPLKTIELSTCVRKSMSYVLPLQNHLNTPAKYVITTNCPCLSFLKAVEVAPLSEVSTKNSYVNF